MSVSSESTVQSHAAAGSSFDVDRIRQDFPILRRDVNGHRLVYLDNAATSQKPQAVIDTLVRYYTEENSNIHRGVHFLSQLATREYEDVRVKVKRFIHAAETHEVIFTRGTTESINLVAATFGRKFINQGDEIIISGLEHHSNIVPWQMLCEANGAVLRVIPLNDRGELEIDVFAQLLNPRTKLVSVAHISNALGTVNPVRRIIEMAHAQDVPVMLDGAQAAPHLAIDVQELDCDFYAFSGHKLCGPTGIGVLYGKSDLLNTLPPWQGGGDMIASVTFEKTTFNTLPHRLEAGTPNIAGGIGLGAAIDYLTGVGLDRIAAYERELLDYATETISAIRGVTIIGTAAEKASVLSFTLDNIHPHDIGTILDQQGVAIRAGHHCAQPVMKRFGIPATARASFAFYNTREEIDALREGIQKAIEVFG